ncbi:MAG: rane protein [Rhizobacter sp.]|nr:rane protein [Rhizobacter sp.]
MSISSSAMPGTTGRAVGVEGAYAAAASTSGVSWGAILAGAFGAAALSFILIILGFGLGLSSVSPWSNSGVTATTFGVGTILWLAFTQIAASGIGGYLAGRLRTKWAGVHTDEVYFRDTAHGFLAWAVASLATAALLASAIGSVLGAGAQVASSAAQGMSTAAATAGAAGAKAGDSDGGGMTDPLGYYVDSMFRTTAAPASPSPDANSASSRAEVTRIVMNSMRNGALQPPDRAYLAQMVSQRTGLAPAEADARVNDVYTRLTKATEDAKNAAKQAADTTRKTAAYAALWMFIALLAGAFCASLAATFGGRQRDDVS